MRKDNRGFTMVELVVVISIIAILATAAGASLGLIYSSHAKQAANEFYSLLNTCRVNTLNGANSAYIELKEGSANGGYVIKVYEKSKDASGTMVYSVKTEREITDVVVSYTATYTDSSGNVISSSDTSLGTNIILLAFDRETGEFTEAPSDAVTTGLNMNSYQLITFTSGSAEYSVKLNWQTGYSEVIK